MCAESAHTCTHTHMHSHGAAAKSNIDLVEGEQWLGLGYMAVGPASCCLLWAGVELEKQGGWDEAEHLF